MKRIVGTQRRTPRSSLPDLLRAPRLAPRRGFSMVELVIVLLVMGILIAVATPIFVDSLLFYRVESAARRLKTDLEYARQTARLTGATMTISFTGKTYTASDTIDGLDHHEELYSVDLSAPPFELSRVTPDFAGLTSIDFNGYGTPSSGGTVVLAARNCQCTLTVNDVTGQITITSNDSRGRTTVISN